MPLYEYQCEACGHRFEVIQKFSDQPIEKCPKCGSPVHKLQSAPAIQFKGSGWYITDYAKKDQSPAGKADSGKKDSGAAASGETKDASKTDKSSDKGTGSDSSASSSTASSTKDAKGT